ncbi:unnamed protein product [Ectocarpus sp. 6 AP-2014]
MSAVEEIDRCCWLWREVVQDIDDDGAVWSVLGHHGETLQVERQRFDLSE